MSSHDGIPVKGQLFSLSTSRKKDLFRTKPNPNPQKTQLTILSGHYVEVYE